MHACYWCPAAAADNSRRAPRAPRLAYGLRELNYVNNSRLVGRFPDGAAGLSQLIRLGLDGTGLSCLPDSVALEQAAAQEEGRPFTPHRCDPGALLPCFLEQLDYLVPRQDASHMACKCAVPTRAPALAPARRACSRTRARASAALATCAAPAQVAALPDCTVSSCYAPSLHSIACALPCCFCTLGSGAATNRWRPPAIPPHRAIKRRDPAGLRAHCPPTMLPVDSVLQFDSFGAQWDLPPSYYQFQVRPATWAPRPAHSWCSASDQRSAGRTHAAQHRTLTLPVAPR